jgi:Protein of unknown function (DUF3435)
MSSSSNPAGQMTRGEAQYARNKAKRKATFDESESRKPPHMRILVRKDLDELVRKTASAEQQRRMKAMLQWFVEFFTEGLDKPLGTEAQARDFFRANGPAMPLKVVRQFFLWIATSRQGQIKSTMSIFSIYSYLRTFFSTIQWYQIRRFEEEVREQVIWWIQQNLTEEASLHRTMKPKPVARVQDVSLLIETLYTPISLCSFSTMRSVLHLDLLINLLIDSAGRIGEIVQQSHAPLEQCLRWEDIELWARKEKKTGAVRIYAIVCFRWQKGKRGKPEDVKKICLKLLDTQYVFQDSLRLLLYLALIEGHLEDVRTWEDIQSLDPSEDGSRIRVKESSMQLPVFRAIENCQLKDTPMQDQTVSKQFVRLGKMAGFRDKFTRQVPILSK